MAAAAAVRVQEQFAAPKDKLYKAWTEEAELKQWWKPMGKALVSVQNDIREGGAVRYQFENDLVVQGKYQEARPGEKLVYSWVWDLPEDSMHKGEYLLTVEFGGDGTNSTLNVSQDNFKSEHSVKPHQDGWEQGLKDLKTYLEGGR